MTDPNVLGGDHYGLKFLFDSGNTRLIHLCRPNSSTGGGGDWPNDNPLSLSIMDSGTAGTQYVVPVSKVFYMLYFWVKQEGTTDIDLAIQRNSTVDNSALGDNLFEMKIEGSGHLAQDGFSVGGLQFNAGDYVTPYAITFSTIGRWAFQCWGIECDA